MNAEKTRAWLFIYGCPFGFYEKDPENHRKHIRYVVIQDEGEARGLAKSNELPWPASSASTGTISFHEIGEEQLGNVEEIVNDILRIRVEAYKRTSL